MRLVDTVFASAAGSGKTTTLVREALANPDKKIAVLTYTLNNVQEIRKTFYDLNGSVPENVEIYPWFTFLLRECARPYQASVYVRRIAGLAFVSGRSARYTRKTDVARYFFSKDTGIYSDKISEFACKCDNSSGGRMIERLTQIYDGIFIDEIQDMAAYDFDFVELLLQSPMRILMAGDNRQATYATNNSAKYKKYKGAKIIELFWLWKRKKLCDIEELSVSHRCNQAICDFGDRLYPDMPRTTSMNDRPTGHDGVFLVSEADLSRYIQRYKPAVLRYDRRTKCGDWPAVNFGEAKGLTFPRVLIFPHGKIQKYLATGNLTHVLKSCPKVYVAVTRARHSVAFVYSGKCRLDNIETWKAPR